jgi:hypothetical protein
LPEPLGELRLREPAVVRELERFALLVRELSKSGLNALSLQAHPRLFVDGPAGQRIVVGELLHASALLTPDEVDRPAVHEREDPRARLRTLGDVAVSGAPDREKCLLHRILGERGVTQDA